MSVSSVSKADPSLVRSLKQERDRFVALAFCAADLLLEVGRDFRIVYAAGATVAYTSASPEDLVGQRLLDIVAQDDRPLLEELFSGMTAGRRLQPINVCLLGPRGPSAPLTLTGYLLPDLPESLFFALRMNTDLDHRRPSGGGDRDPGSGLNGPKAFAKHVSERLKLAKQRGEDVRLTLIRLQDFARLSQSLDAETADATVKAIAASLRLNAGSDDAVAKFDDENFGLVHRADADIDYLTSRIETHIRTADPAGKGIAVKTGTVKPDIGDTADADLVKALHYAVRQFCQEDDPESAISGLSENLHSKVHEASRRMSDFRAIVSGVDFDVAFQPIVRIETREVIYFEALARFGGGSERSPYELISFAENTGLICDFDFAMCRKLLQLIGERNAAGNPVTVAMNLSGGSIGSDAFLGTLQALLDEHGALRRQLIVEITESIRIGNLEQANRFIQSLRKFGHKVCLDDFGAGAAALQYLHALDVDVVKIDGQYVLNAVQDRKVRAFIRAIAGLCRELTIDTVAEMIEDEPTTGILRDCGVEYGQGYLFGRPSTDTSVFDVAETGTAPVSNAGSKRRRGPAKSAEGAK